jgi:hypothetical protein
MNLQGHTDDKIMRLPDHCFGRQWRIGGIAEGFNNARRYVQQVFSVPNDIVIWGMAVNGDGTNQAEFDTEIRLGNEIPSNDLKFLAMEPVFPEVYNFELVPSYFKTIAANDVSAWNFRQPVHPNGRGIIFAMTQRTTGTHALSVNLLISGFPSEVGECFRSHLE